ncbi:hypothetical protein [Natronorubrum daqingense]|nr:hypothetical protein [Natronorubrum daqingense]
MKTFVGATQSVSGGEADDSVSITSTGGLFTSPFVVGVIVSK